VAEDVNIGQTDSFTANLSSGAYSDTKDYVIVIGLILEDWETGDFTSFNWTFGGGDWFITDQNPYEGEYCVQSADISDNQQTSLEITYEVGTAGTLSFYKKVSSEGDWDYLRFFIDGEEKASWSGEVAWSMEEYELSVGQHTLKWQYDKDGNTSEGADAAWVDYIVFPPMALPSIVMETEAEICAGDTYTSDAVVDNYETLEWSTNGDGTFDDETIAMATYTPGSDDIANGYVELSLLATGSNGNVMSNLELYVFATSVAAPSVPDGEQNLCINPEDQIYTTNVMPGYELSWMLEPLEAGTLTSENNQVTIMWDDEFVDEAQLSVKASSICAESEYSDPLVIQVNQLPELSIETEHAACYGQEFIMTGDLSGLAPWTVNIEGYGEMQVEESPMEMSWMAMNDSIMTINWVKDANTCMNSNMITVNVDVNESPIVTLEDSTICVNHEIVLDAGNPGAEYEWSTGKLLLLIPVVWMKISKSRYPLWLQMNSIVQPKNR